MKPLVLYHANCWDGFCAAWVAHWAIGDIEAMPVHYGQDPPDVSDREVYILDFSYKRPLMLDLIDKAKLLVVLDHHKTAAEELTGLQGEWTGRPIKIVFDMDKSGGRMAWEHFFDDRCSPWLVDYTEDRDLWRWQLPGSRAINAALRSHPLDFDLWDQLKSRLNVLSDFCKEGEAILRREQQIVTDHVDHARETELAGYKVLCVNATTLFSEIAGELAKGRPFGACYFDRADGKRQWSLRSDANGLDVSQVAKQFGGGGHKNAAGFETSLTPLG